MIGRISKGIGVLEQQIAQSDSIGDQTRAAWRRIVLAEIYIQIVSGGEKPPVAVLFRNFWAIAAAMMFGANRARTLLQRAAATKMLSERGVHIARINFDLGVLSAMKKNRVEAKDYFEKARESAEYQDAGKLRQKIDVALAGLQ